MMYLLKSISPKSVVIPTLPLLPCSRRTAPWTEPHNVASSKDPVRFTHTDTVHGSGRSACEKLNAAGDFVTNPSTVVTNVARSPTTPPPALKLPSARAWDPPISSMTNWPWLNL